jgi:hypothetical protein
MVSATTIAKIEHKLILTAERLDIIDFCDAAGEWGSIVPIPAREAERMIELANQMRIADLENPQPRLEDRQPLRDERHPRLEERLLPHEERRPLQQCRQPPPDHRPQFPDIRQSFHENRPPQCEVRYLLQGEPQAWRGDEYSLPEHRQEPREERLLAEDRTPQPDSRRARRVSFADQREYFEVGHHEFQDV